MLAQSIKAYLPHRDQLAHGRKAINVSFEEFKGWFSLATEFFGFDRLLERHFDLQIPIHADVA